MEGQQEAWDSLYRGQDRPWRGVADISWTEIRPGDRVLELGCGNGKTAEALLERGIRHVVIKAGEQGLYAADGESGERFMLPALKVPVVDTTGAGDNLVAGFMDGLLKGAGFRECCEAGIRAAAKSIGHLGATREMWS